MRLIHRLHLLVLAAVAAAAAACAADNGQTSLVPSDRDSDRGAHERISFQAILVIASDAGATDASLADYEATLKRVLRFNAFRRAGDGSTSVADGGEATVAIGRGHGLDIWVTSVTDREIVFGVRWFKGNRTLANTKVTRPRHSNTVFGGPVVEGGGGTYAVIVTAN